MSRHEIAAITRHNQSLDGVSWNILGQVYTPKQITEDSFSWHALFPEETFVPPHTHVDQDEYIFVIEGRIDLILDGQTQSAQAGACNNAISSTASDFMAGDSSREGFPL